jgi:Holliday junction DNA helicase RuvA
MISFLRGQILETDGETLTLDVSGVGYELLCSTSTMDAVFGVAEARLHVYTAVREDAITLYGFATPLEKKLFVSLLKVNGIGPKLAIKVLSGATLSQLLDMIERSDVKGLSSLPKVGKKTAEQLILALKGKLVLDDVVAGEGVRSAGGRVPQKRDDIVSALVNLGFKLPDVERVVAGIPADLDLQQGIRQGLTALTGH